jgi:hypothetical protein
MHIAERLFTTGCSNHCVHPFQFGGWYAFRSQKAKDHLTGGSVEDSIQEAGSTFIAAEVGRVNKRSPIQLMRYQALLLHNPKHGLHRVISQFFVLFDGQQAVNGADTARTFFPKHL